jgi:serine/threonine protein kinase
MSDLERRVTDIEKEDIVIRLRIRRKLDLIFELAENEIKWDFTPNDILYEKLSEIAGYLPYLDEKMYIDAVDEGLASKKEGIQNIFYEKIRDYARLEPEEFEKIFCRKFEDANPIYKDDNRKRLAAALDGLLPEHPEVYIRIFEKMLKKESIPSEMSEAYKNLGRLQKINPEKYEEFIQRGLGSGLLVKIAAEVTAHRVRRGDFEPEEEKEDISGFAPIWIEDAEDEILNYLEESVNAPKSSWEEKYKLPERFVEEKELEALEKIFKACGKEWEKKPLDKLRELVINPITDLVKISEYLDKGFDLDEAFECPSIRVQGYEIVRKLGEGGFGKAYLIQRRKIGTKHVLKVCGSREALEEAKKYAVLQDKHLKNVAEFQEFYDENDNPITINGEKRSAIRIAYIEGKSLRELIEEKGSLDLKLVRNVCSDVLEGLKGLNEQGLIHRDIKPENIMISDDGTVKLIDLGLTSSVDIAEEFTLNRLYAAPEGRKGKTNNPNFDYWGFGLVLYEMLAGEHLVPVPEKHKSMSYKSFVRQEFDSWIEKACGEGIAKEYKDRIKKIPRPYRRIVSRCLRRADRRYQSVDEIIKDLEEPVFNRLSWITLAAIAVCAGFAYNHLSNLSKVHEKSARTEQEAVMTAEEQSRLSVLVKNHLACSGEIKEGDIRLRKLERSEHNLEGMPEENGARFLSLNGFTHFNIKHQDKVYRLKVADISPNNPEKMHIEPYTIANKITGQTLNHARLIVSSQLETGLMYSYYININQQGIASFERLFAGKRLNFPIIQSIGMHPSEEKLIVPPEIPIVFKTPQEYEFTSKSDGEYYEITGRTRYEEFKGVDWFIDGKIVQEAAKEYMHSFTEGRHLVEIDSKKYGVRARWEVIVDPDLRPNLKINERFPGERRVKAGEKAWFTAGFTKDSYVPGDNIYVDFIYDGQRARQNMKAANGEMLEAGTTDVYPATKIKIDKPGRYTMTVRLDPDNLIEESDENDNEADFNLIVE